jgi:hypothetical protein
MPFVAHKILSGFYADMMFLRLLEKSFFFKRFLVAKILMLLFVTFHSFATLQKSFLGEGMH